MTSQFKYNTIDNFMRLYNSIKQNSIIICHSYMQNLKRNLNGVISHRDVYRMLNILLLHNFNLENCM